MANYHFQPASTLRHRTMMRRVVLFAGVMGLACLCCRTVQAAPETPQSEPAASTTKNPPPLQEAMPQGTNRNGCMNSLLFFDDWFLHAREGLDRRQGRPQCVKEVSVKFQPDPDLKSIREHIYFTINVGVAIQ